MPEPRIVVVDGQQHAFPPDATDAEISDVLNGPSSQGWMSSLRSIVSPEGVAALKKYGQELVSGDGKARSEVTDYAKKEFGTAASDVAHPVLHPLETIGGAANAVLHPLDTVSNVAGVAKSALEGEPTAIGHVMGAVVAPKVYGATLRGTNTIAQAVADSPKLQGTAGYIGGAGVGIAGGGHPFIMGRIGQAAAPVVGGAARAVANGTGAIMDTLGMERSGALPKEFDRYAPNSSGYRPFSGEDNLDAMVNASSLPKGIAQGVYAQLPDGTWGVQAVSGHTLVPSEPVNVMNRAGQATVHTVGKIGPDGIATIGLSAPLPTEPMFFGGSKITDPRLREIILKHLKHD